MLSERATASTLSATALHFALAALLLLPGCGGPEAEAPSAAGATDAPAAAAEEPATAAPAPNESSCPPLGPLTKSWNAGDSPLVFEFRYPEGFEPRKDQMVGESMYQLDMVKQHQVDGRDRQVTFSILQTMRKVDSAIPREIQFARDNPDNPAMKALSEMTPKSAGTISYGGQDVEIFRIDTDIKSVYKLNLPVEGGYQPINVHFVPAATGVPCVDRLKELGEEWIRTLTPANR